MDNGLFVGEVGLMTPFLLEMKRENRLRKLSYLFVDFIAVLFVIVFAYSVTRVIFWLGTSEIYWCFERGVCP